MIVAGLTLLAFQAGRKKHRRRRKQHSCGKRRYRDQTEALEALHNWSKPAPGYNRAPVRAYECERCKGWHLTGQAEPGKRAA